MLTDPFRYAGDSYSKVALKDIPLKEVTKEILRSGILE